MEIDLRLVVFGVDLYSFGPCLEACDLFLQRLDINVKDIALLS